MSTVKVTLAGVGSWLASGLAARTVKVCSPSLSVAVVMLPVLQAVFDMVYAVDAALERGAGDDSLVRSGNRGVSEGRRAVVGQRRFAYTGSAEQEGNRADLDQDLRFGLAAGAVVRYPDVDLVLAGEPVTGRVGGGAVR